MYLDSDDVDEPNNPGATRTTPTWNLEFQITRFCSDTDAITPEDVDYALHEGHGSVLSFPGSLGDPSSSDYLAVTLPALPDGYMATITLGGTASAMILLMRYAMGTIIMPYRYSSLTYTAMEPGKKSLRTALWSTI